MAEPIPSPNKKEVVRLQNRIIDEILFALGMVRTGWARSLFGPLFLWPAHHFAAIVAKFQSMVPEIGFGLTARQALPEFNARVTAHGLDLVPAIRPTDRGVEPRRRCGYAGRCFLHPPQRSEDHGIGHRVPACDEHRRRLFYLRPGGCTWPDGCAPQGH